METTQMAPEELGPYFKSKRDLYNLLSIDWNLHLPKYKFCPLEFMRDILKGKKKALSKDEVVSVIVPRYPELTVEEIWDKIKDVEDLTIYFPEYDEGKIPQRDYLISIISTLNLEATKQIVEDARKNRSVMSQNEPGELIEITEEFREKLMKTAPQKTTKGISNYLLKAKAKLKRPRKLPKKYPAKLDKLKNTKSKKEEEKMPVGSKYKPYSVPTVTMQDAEDHEGEDN